MMKYRCPCACCKTGVEMLAHDRLDGIDWCTCVGYGVGEWCDCAHCRWVIASRWGLPSQKDIERAEAWRYAKEQGATAWLALSPEQQLGLNFRMDWVATSLHEVET